VTIRSSGRSGEGWLALWARGRQPPVASSDRVTSFFTCGALLPAGTTLTWEICCCPVAECDIPIKFLVACWVLVAWAVALPLMS
jgi:hypothetical protein